MRINRTRQFKKQYKKLPAKVQAQFKQKVLVFVSDPYHPSLHNHKLTGQYREYRSINITGNYRAVFFQHTESHIEFDAIGTHAQLYG